MKNMVWQDILPKGVGVVTGIQYSAKKNRDMQKFIENPK